MNKRCELKFDDFMWNYCKVSGTGHVICYKLVACACLVSVITPLANSQSAPSQSQLREAASAIRKLGIKAGNIPSSYQRGHGALKNGLKAGRKNLPSPGGIKAMVGPNDQLLSGSLSGLTRAWLKSPFAKSFGGNAAVRALLTATKTQRENASVAPFTFVPNQTNAFTFRSLATQEAKGDEMTGSAADAYFSVEGLGVGTQALLRKKKKLAGQKSTGQSAVPGTQGLSTAVGQIPPALSSSSQMRSQENSGSSQTSLGLSSPMEDNYPVQTDSSINNFGLTGSFGIPIQRRQLQPVPLSSQIISRSDLLKLGLTNKDLKKLPTQNYKDNISVTKKKLKQTGRPVPTASSRTVPNFPKDLSPFGFSKPN